MFLLLKGVRQVCFLVQCCEIESSCHRSIQLHPDLPQLVLLLFADNVILFSDTFVCLQGGIYVLHHYC